MENYGFKQKVTGLSLEQFMAGMLEKNEKMEMEIERGNLSVAILKQMNNVSRLQLDAAKYALKASLTYTGEENKKTEV